MSKKFVYLFSEGNGTMRELLGGKGANLAEMTRLGMPVPMGFTITTEACTDYYESGKKISADIEKEIFTYLEKLEAITGKEFGNPENPLLLSVRSGARASMPGMMTQSLTLVLTTTLLKVSANSQATADSLWMLTADLSRCSLTLLWVFQNLCLMKLLKALKQ